MATEERRKFPRLVLHIDDGYFGNFKLNGGGSLAAPLVNISAEGMNIAFPQAAQDKVSVGDTIVLQNIAGGAHLSFLTQITAEIRWIKQLDTPGYVSVGCMLTNLTEQTREQLIHFVDEERRARGQYGSD